MDPDVAALIVSVFAAALSALALILGALRRRQDQRVQRRERELRGEDALDLALAAQIRWDDERSGSAWREVETYVERARALLPPESVRLVRYRAYRARDRGDVSGALALLEPLAGTPAANGRYWLDVAWCHREAGDEAAFAAALERARADPDHRVDALIPLARLRARQARFDDALGLIADAEAREPRNPGVHQARADILLARAGCGLDAEQSIVSARRALLITAEHAFAEKVGDIVVDLALTYRPTAGSGLPAPTDEEAWVADRLLDLAAQAGSVYARRWRAAVTADGTDSPEWDRAGAEAAIARVFDGWQKGEHPGIMVDAILDTLLAAAPHLAHPAASGPAPVTA